MNKHRNRSISFKITFSILIAFAVIFCCISLFIYYSVHTILLNEVENQLTAVYEQVEGEWSQGPDNLKSIVEDLNYKLQVVIFAEDGTMMYSNYARIPLDLTAGEGFSEIRIDNDMEGNYENPDHYLVYRSLPMAGDPPLIIQISKDLEDEDRFFMILIELLIVSNLLGISLAAFIGYKISTRILKPVDGITSKAQAISAEDLSSRIPSSGTNDEISRLIDAFNEMLTRLENSFNRQQRFVADASHELRTPVSVIQGYTGMLQRWAKENPALLEEALDTIKSETLRMKNLMDRLLFLARSDSEGIAVQSAHVDMSHLLKDIAKDFRKSHQTHDINVSSPERIILSCDPELVRQLIRILVDNAIKYSPGRTKVDISASVDNMEKTCSVTVTDYGEGIGEAHFSRLFDRFYRVDDSRARDKGGAGIGLSIAKEICEAHGGTLSVSSRIGEGSEFTFILPLNIN